jgi:hypothetical protein
MGTRPKAFEAAKVVYQTKSATRLPANDKKPAPQLIFLKSSGANVFRIYGQLTGGKLRAVPVCVNPICKIIARVDVKSPVDSHEHRVNARCADFH